MKGLTWRSPEDVMHLFYDYAEKDDNFATEIVLNLVNSAVQRQLGKVNSEWLYDFMRFGELNPKPSIYYELTATELLFVATLAAVKFLQDADSVDAVKNQTWAEDLSIEFKDIKKVELAFYEALNWHLFVSNFDFVDFVTWKLIVPIRSHIEARNKSKDRMQSPVSQLSNFQTNQLTTYNQQRKRIFAKLPSTRSVAFAATALLTISCSASLLYHQMVPRRSSSTSLSCDLLDPCLPTPTFMFSNQMICGTNRPTSYTPPSNEPQSYPLIKYSPCPCSVQMSSQLVQNTASWNSTLLIPRIS